jgi:hypothetical protein
MAKRKKTTIDTIADVQLHRVLMHPTVLFLVATLVIIAGVIGLWRANRTSLVRRAEHFLTLDRIDSTPQPDWIRNDLKRTVFDGCRLAEVSLLDVDAVPRVADAFSVQPWVANVSIQKRPLRMSVAITYRQPVGLVEYGERLLLPVDGQGTVLDGSDFNPESAGEFLRISVESPFTGSLVSGEAWPDDRVIAAAYIAQQIRERARAWGIARIHHIPLEPESTAAGGDFELLTARGAAGPRALWGNPPGFETSGERSAAEKIRYLDDVIAVDGPIDSWPSGRTIDVRFPATQLTSGR